MKTVKDPHHYGDCEWGYENGSLFHKTFSQSKWTRVKKISFTPARIKAIVTILEETK